METSYFPIHLGIAIYLLTAATGVAFWAIHALRDRREVPGPTLFVLGLVLVAGYALAAWAATIFILVPGATTFGLPNLALAIAISVGAGVTLLNWRPVREMVDAVPLAAFAAFHTLRIPFGLLFLAFQAQGAIPDAFAFRGGYGDLFAGILGGVAALLVLGGARPLISIGALALFSAVGLLDFAIVLYTGLTTLSPDAPFQAFYPFTMIPGYVVPLFMLSHLFILRNMLGRLSKSNHTRDGLVRAA